MDDQLVTLIDGRTVGSDSEECRHECEARAIADLRTLADRRIWLEDIERKRGKTAADQLRATMKALWEAKAGRPLTDQSRARARLPTGKARL